MVGQIVSGAGQPFFLNVPTHYSDKWFSAASRVSATALMSLANAIGAAVGQLVDPFLAPNANDIPSMVVYFAKQANRSFYTTRSSLRQLTLLRHLHQALHQHHPRRRALSKNYT
jgi:hypothetical protein